MILGLVTKLDKLNTTTSTKKNNYDGMLENCEVIIFLIFGQFGAI